MKHCRRCGFIPEAQPKKPIGPIHTKTSMCVDHPPGPCEPESSNPGKCASCRRRKCGPDAQRRADLKAKAAADKAARKAKTS